MKKALLEYLICPNCLPDEFELKTETIELEKDDIVSGSLVCIKCGKTYPIRDGIAFLINENIVIPNVQNKYETLPGISSYIWSHYFDITGEKPVIDNKILPPYVIWADMIKSPGLFLDIGCAVGRFAFEVSKKADFVIGVDLSVNFIKTAKNLAKMRRIKANIIEEGNITTEKEIVIPDEWHTERTEFIVADAMNLPFRKDVFNLVTSLNLIDKVPYPLKHLKELNRVAKKDNAECIIADPFSWSTDVAPPNEWLGGKNKGLFSGYGIENLKMLIEGKDNIISPSWKIKKQSFVPWIIRNHRNHYEYIFSQYVIAERS